MRVRSPPPIGNQERVVLQTVWQLGRCTVREVFDVVGAPQALAYTTIATALDRLHAKGFVARELDGKAFVYRAAPRKGTTQRALAQDMVRKILGPDPSPAVATLVDAVEAIDPRLLERLAEEVARRRTRRGS
jgi:predicted transcriptional regulator